MNTVKVSVTSADIERAERDPSVCPVTRAVSRTLRENLIDVDIASGSVYIWNEWDSPNQVYILNEDATNFVCDWGEDVSPQPFNFEMKKRR